MRDPEILLHQIPEPGDDPVPLPLRRRQPATPGVLPHDPVLDTVEMKKVPVLLPMIALVGIDDLDGLLGMHARRHTEGEIGTVMMGGGGYLRGQEETMVGLHAGMLLETEVGTTLTDRPVGIEIPGEFPHLPVTIQLPLGGSPPLPFLLEFLLTHGFRGRLDESRVHGHSRRQGETEGGDLVDELRVDPPHEILPQAATEAGEGRMIGCGFMEGKTQESPKGNPIVDLSLQLLVGPDAVPLPQEEALEKEQGWIGGIPFVLLPHGVSRGDDLLHPLPVDEAVDLVQSLHGPVFLEGSHEGVFGEAQVPVHLLEAHMSSGRVSILKEHMA